jgi:hypothetical protein
MWNAMLGVMLGMWIVVAPFALTTAFAWNNRIAGLLVLAATAFTRPPHRWENVAAATTGLWLFLFSFVPPLLGRGVWNNIVAGVIIVITGTVSAQRLRSRVPGA